MRPGTGSGTCRRRWCRCRCRGTWCLLVVALVGAGCDQSGSRSPADQDARAPLGEQAPDPGETEHLGDTVVFGSDRWSAPDSVKQRLIRQEPDRILLERLLSQYAGMDHMLEHAWQDEQSKRLMNQAFGHERGEDRNRARLEALLHEEYHERYEPNVPPRYLALAESVKVKTGAEQEKEFRQVLLETHEQALVLIDSFQPLLRRPAVRAGVNQVRRALDAEAQTLERQLARP